MIQGIGYNNPYGMYNRIQYPNQNDEALKNLNRNALKSADENVATQAVPVTPTLPQMDLKLDSIRPRGNAPLEDISLSLDNSASFEMKGRDSDISALDISKAVSDMQKDEALMQYQYFVGGDNSVFSSEDGMVVAKAY